MPDYLETLHQLESDIALSEFGATISPALYMPEVIYRGKSLIFRSLLPEARSIKLLGLVCDREQVMEPWYLSGDHLPDDASSLRALMKAKMASAFSRAKEQIDLEFSEAA
jgi:hypothetical protein